MKLLFIITFVFSIGTVSLATGFLYLQKHQISNITLIHNNKIKFLTKDKQQVTIYISDLKISIFDPFHLKLSAQKINLKRKNLSLNISNLSLENKNLKSASIKINKFNLLYNNDISPKLGGLLSKNTLSLMTRLIKYIFKTNNKIYIKDGKITLNKKRYKLSIMIDNNLNIELKDNKKTFLKAHGQREDFNLSINTGQPNNILKMHVNYYADNVFITPNDDNIMIGGFIILQDSGNDVFLLKTSIPKTIKTKYAILKKTFFSIKNFDKNGYVFDFNFKTKYMKLINIPFKISNIININNINISGKLNLVNKNNTIIKTTGISLIDDNTKIFSQIKVNMDNKLYNSIFDIKLRAYNIPIVKVPTIWPKELFPNTRQWVTSKVIKGQINSISFNTKITLKNDGTFNMTKLYGDMYIKNSNLKDYAYTLPTMSHIDAFIKYNQNNFNINIQKADYKNTQISNSKVNIVNIPNSDFISFYIDLNISGQLNTLIPVLQEKPFDLSLLKNLTQNKGVFKAKTNLDLKLNVKNKKFKMLSLKATLSTPKYSFNYIGTNFIIANIKSSIDKNHSYISGIMLSNGNKLNLNLAYQSINKKFKINMNGITNMKTFRLMGVGLTKGQQKKPITSIIGTKESLTKYLQGPITITTSIIGTEENFSFNSKINLNATKIDINEIGFSKKKNIPLNGILSGKKYKQTLIINKFILTDRRKTNILSANFSYDDNFNINTLKFKINTDKQQFKFSYNNDYKTTIMISGQKADISILNKNTNNFNIQKFYKKDINIKIKKLKINKKAVLNDFHLDLMSNKNTLHNFILRAQNTKHNFAIDIELIPQIKKGPILEAQIVNLGYVLSTLDISNDFKNGTLNISAATGNDGIMLGTIKSRGLIYLNPKTIYKAFQLLSITSSLSSNTNVKLFTNGKFSVHNKIIKITKLLTTAPGFAISLQGSIYLKKNDLDLQGLLIPDLLINRFISYIPILGTILSGNNEAILGINYNITGPILKPKYSTNIIKSILPGILKNIPIF